MSKYSLENASKDRTILTEHLDDLSLQGSSTDTDIHNQDTAWLRESDFAIAECSNLSLGMLMGMSMRN